MQFACQPALLNAGFLLGWRFATTRGSVPQATCERFFDPHGAHFSAARRSNLSNRFTAAASNRHARETKALFF